ncbi:CvpA family protein [Faecalibacter macacae]|uniref:CvpA family protein n=1 Tax=Faecalibacter macacae TaxID=1859289 RepID=A0A3L9MF15_9FLAO|nr:CvpA family protein [Faecalibacter macacae]RLZ11463.1 CvpA family protein [Faecalibacter macacae]
MDQASTFNNLDILIAIALAFGVINGLFKGFISQLIGLLGFFIAIWLSFKFYQFVSIFIGSQNIVADSLVSIVSLVLTFAIAFFSIKLLSSLTQKTVEMIGLGFVNRIAGAALGLVILLLLVSSVLFYIDPILEIGFKETKENSILYPYLIESAEYVKNMLYETKDVLREQNQIESENYL